MFKEVRLFKESLHGKILKMAIGFRELPEDVRNPAGLINFGVIERIEENYARLHRLEPYDPVRDVQEGGKYEVLKALHRTLAA